MTEQTKNFYGLKKGKDGLYHSEYGDTFTEKDLRTGPWGAIMMLTAVAGLVACTIGGCAKSLVKNAKKPASIEQKQAMNAATTKVVFTAGSER